MLKTSALLCETVLDTAMPGELPPAQKYERIVSLGKLGCDWLWSSEPDAPLGTDLRRLYVPAALSDRLYGYWASHFADPAQANVGRNCVEFALRMREGWAYLPQISPKVDASWCPSFRAMEHLYDLGDKLDVSELASVRLRAGGLAIFASDWARSTGSKGDVILDTNILHAAIATGESIDTPWLNVVASNGALGLTGLQDSFVYYRDFSFPGQTETAWEDIHVRVIE